MPSLSDIANDVQNLLTQIETNTRDTADTVALVKGDTADLLTKLDALIDVNTQGFANLSLGLAAMIQQQQLTNFMLDHHRKQFDTMICWLENIADVACRQLHRQNKMVELLAEIESEDEQVREILERVHGDEAISALRDREARAKIEECCPEDEAEEEHCYDKCKKPDFRRPDQKGMPFEPIRQPKLG